MVLLLKGKPKDSIHLYFYLWITNIQNSLGQNIIFYEEIGLDIKPHISKIYHLQNNNSLFFVVVVVE